MMQIVSVLTQYAEGLFLLMWGLTIVLLLVTLHKIKRISKLMQEIVGNTNGHANVQPMSRAPEENLQKVQGQAKEENLENAQSQAELLSAVLDEVFP